MTSCKTHLLTTLLLLTSFLLQAQWTNRYPKVQGYGHHVYLEAFELPILNAGPTDPAPSPNGDQLAFVAKGWLWILDHQTGVAKRLTSSGQVDAKPNWSSDASKLVFIRDNGSDTKIMMLELGSGEEKQLVDTEAMELDPVFSNNDQSVFYASAEEGTFDLWKLNLSSMQKEKITSGASLERLPIPFSADNQLLYLKKQGFSYDSFERMDLNNGTSQTVLSDNFISQASFTLSPDGRTLAYTWPQESHYELRITDLTVPSHTMLLTGSEGLPLSPKFSADGKWVFYCEVGDDERQQLKKMPVTGGKPQVVEIKQWDWGVSTKTVKIRTQIQDEATPARIQVVNDQGHPFVPKHGLIHSEGQYGSVFFYSDGACELELPHGNYTITAVQGFSTKVSQHTMTLNESTLSEIQLDLEQIWDARAAGWYAGDNHFHLNYGGSSRLDPEDIILEMKGEGLDMGFPLLANLHNRFLDQQLWGWENDSPPFIRFGQEVRSHFLGHLNLLGTQELFWPWVWGPFYDLYGRDDRLNAEALRFTREQKALAGYVHPVGVRDPMTEQGMSRIPVELVADYVLGEVDILEVGCLWTDEVGTSEMWHKFLNLGIPVTLSAGSDVMNDYYRTMATGAARVYVKPEGAFTVESYLQALKKGTSFVSTGPLLEFQVEGNEAGGIITRQNGKAKWKLTTHSVVPYETIEVIVNGKVVWSKKGKSKSGSHQYQGSVKIPEGGWITARVYGGSNQWPFLDSYPFAESGAIWFQEIGSTEKSAKVQSAGELLQILGVSTERLVSGYREAPIPKLRGHFEKARKKLAGIIEE